MVENLKYKVCYSRSQFIDPVKTEIEPVMYEQNLFLELSACISPQIKMNYLKSALKHRIN